MNKTKIILPLTLSVLAIFLPIIILFSAVLLTPKVYTNTFVGALNEKYDRLNSIDEPKIVVVGGSSVAFGIDSALMEEYLGMPVVNFGLYAALGTKLMMDLAKSNINNGDIIILAPELDRQTLSLYFSSEHTLEALDDNYSMARHLSLDDRLKLLGGMWKHGSKKLTFMREGIPNPDGIYNSASFNEYGDILDVGYNSDGTVIFSRDKNVMHHYYDTSTVIDLDSSIVSEDFIDYVNDYVKYCERRGAKVYFSFCPMNEIAFREGTTEDSISAFSKYLENRINCEFISYIDSYIYEAGYFYDTNFHLNSAGVVKRTKTLIEDIMIVRGNYSPVDITVPEAPPLPLFDTVFFGEDENDKYFTYEKIENGAYKITGLTELGKTMQTLTLPRGAYGIKVTELGAFAFSSGVCKTVVVTSDTNLRNFMDNSFADSSVRDLYIYYDFKDESEKLSPASDFSGVTIHVPNNSQYLTHYDWTDTSGGYKIVVID